MQPLTIRISLDDNGPGVVVQNLARNTAQGFEQSVMAGKQGIGLLVSSKPDPAPTAVAQGGSKCVQRVAAAPKDHKVTLHLLTGFRLETYDRFGPGCWLMSLHE